MKTLSILLVSLSMFALAPSQAEARDVRFQVSVGNAYGYGHPGFYRGYHPNYYPGSYFGHSSRYGYRPYYNPYYRTSRYYPRHPHPYGYRPYGYHRPYTHYYSRPRSGFSIRLFR